MVQLQSIYFPQSVKKIGANVELFHMSTYQCSILFNNMVSFKRKGEFRKPQNLNKPIAKNERYYVTDLTLLREFWGNSYAHVVLTAEADSLPTHAKQLFEEYRLVGCHSTKGNYLSVHARIDSTGYVRLLWESNDEDDKGPHAAIFEVKFGQKAEGSLTDSREQTADTLFSDLESVALVIEDNDTKDNFVSTAECLQDTRKRQLVTRSGLQRMRCQHRRHRKREQTRLLGRSMLNARRWICARSKLRILVG